MLGFAVFGFATVDVTARRSAGLGEHVSDDEPADRRAVTSTVAKPNTAKPSNPYRQNVSRR